jgi:trehalose/maltose transport system substrate-binding protein
MTKQLRQWGMILLVGYGLALPVGAVELTISCGAVGQERALCEQATQAWAQQSGHQVRVSSPPQRTNERYFKYLIDLGNSDPRVDVYQIDIIWPALLSEYFLDLREFVPPEEIAQHIPNLITHNTVDGRLVGLPWFTDVGLLYYRKDLLEQHGFAVPRDWATLAEVALAIQSAERADGNPALWGYVFQGGAYEGLTCNALEWLNAYGGGTIVKNDGTITVNNPQAVLALARAASWVGLLAPERVTSFDEELALNTFQLGQAVFMRNWPFAWALLNAPDSAVAGQVGVTALPRGGPAGQAAGTLGGWQLAVSKFSRHPAEAAELVRYLTSAAVQKQRAIAGAYAPTLAALYDDPEVLRANPFFAQLLPLLQTAVARPTLATGAQYMAVSTRFWEAVHRTLLGAASAPDSLAALQDQLQLIKRRGGW